MADYIYSISSDVTAQAVAPRKLHDEIEESTVITVVLDGVNVDEDTLTVVFVSTLPAPQETELDTIVLNHDGVKVEDKRPIKDRNTAWENMLGKLKRLTRPGGPHSNITNPERRTFIWDIIQTQFHDRYIYANARQPLINFIDGYNTTNPKFTQPLQDRLIAIIDF